MEGVKVSKLLQHNRPDPLGIQQLGSAGSRVSLASLHAGHILSGYEGPSALLQAWLQTDILGEK